MIIDLLLEKKVSPLELIENLKSDKQIYGLVNWYFYKYRTCTFVSKLIKDCILNEYIKDLKKYRKIIEELFLKDPDQNEVLYIHCLVDSGLFKKALEYIESVNDQERKDYLTCFFYLQKKEYVKLLEVFNLYINNNLFVSSFFPAIISELSTTKTLKCLELTRKLLSNKHKYSDETCEVLDAILYQLTQDKQASLIVACMDREDNLIRTLKSWINVPYIKQIIIIDYSSKKLLSSNIDIQSLLLNDSRIEIVRVDGEKTFNLGKAYNLAVDQCEYDTIIKIDSDYECIDTLWLDIFFSSSEYDNTFIHADYKFSLELSGFFIMPKSKFLHFREDLNGYGYDEIDLYSRIKNHFSHIKEIIWFDIEKSIRHIDHDNKYRTKNYLSNNTNNMERKNRELCQTHSPSSPLRNTYISTDSIIRYNQTHIDRMFCINLTERYDRWSKIKKQKKIERFNAIRLSNNLDQYGLQLNPVDLSSYLYFTVNSGALGCYISHYLLWNKIVNENIQYALILEDDINIESVNYLLKSNIILEDLEFIQLSKRIRYNNKFLFDGGESYIVSLEGAKKLIDFTHKPYLLSSVNPEKFKSVYTLCEKNMIKDIINWNHNYSITCAVDKFMGYCCDYSLPEEVRLKHFVYPIIDLDTNTCRLSNINQKSKNAWELSEQEVLKYVI